VQKAPFGPVQTLPHAPQLLGSVAVFTQAPLQRLSPPVHAHEPPLQVCPLRQAMPQPPQFLGSLFVLISQPSIGLLLQSLKPGLQDWMAQAPDWQAGVALLTEQTMPQPPQFLVSVWVFTQAPLHSTCPLGQGIVQTPRLQLVPCLQTEPHAPQLLGSVCSFTHKPLQFVCPAPHEDPLQVPLTQAWPVAHAVPHAPQLEGLEVKVVQNPLQDVPEQASVSPAACILYSTSRLASAPV